MAIFLYYYLEQLISAPAYHPPAEPMGAWISQSTTNLKGPSDATKRELETVLESGLALTGSDIPSFSPDMLDLDLDLLIFFFFFFYA